MTPDPQKLATDPSSTLTEKATPLPPEEQPSAGSGPKFTRNSTQEVMVDSPTTGIPRKSTVPVDHQPVEQTRPKFRKVAQGEQQMFPNSPSSPDVFQYDLNDPSSIPYHIVTMNVDPKDIPTLAMRRAQRNGISPHVMRRILPCPLQLGNVQQSPMASPSPSRSLRSVPSNPVRIWNAHQSPLASPILPRSGQGSPVMWQKPRTVLRRQVSQPLFLDHRASSPHRKTSNQSLLLILEEG